MLKDGWLATGDIATMDDDGYLSIVDRKKDMILVSGFNVYPNEVEAVLAAHPGVARGGGARRARIRCAARRWSRSSSAAIRRSPPTPCRQHARASLTNYKVPRTVVFRDELPKSNVGKVLRKDLRDAASAAHKA